MRWIKTHQLPRETKLSNSLEGTKLANLLRNNNLNFRLARDRVVHLKASANSLCQLASNYFFAIFELGGVIKHLMTDTTGNSDICFLSTSVLSNVAETLRVSVKQNLLFPLRPVVKCLMSAESDSTV